MKRELILSLFSVVLITQSIFASNNCTVIGVHEPNSNVYDGPTWCDSVILPDITVRGPLTITGSKIAGKMSVSGPVKSSHSSIESITIESNFSQNKIILETGTTISKNIVFKGIKGIVYRDKTSCVNGHIINGDEKLLR